MINQLDANYQHNDIDQYYKIGSLLEPLKVPIDYRRLLQVDLNKTPEVCDINMRVAGTVRKGLEVLNRLTPSLKFPHLDAFKKAFYERYESQEIPLLVALDNETGIGYQQKGEQGGDKAPFVDDVPVYPDNQATSFDLPMDSHKQFFLKKYIELKEAGANEWEVSEEDLSLFNANWENTSDTLSVMMDILENEDRPLIFLKSVGGSSGANLLGRFTHSNEVVHQFTKELTELERQLNPDTVLAEILHLPQARTGNVILREQLRDYEIPFLAKASVDEAHQIALKDLMISIKGSKIVLRSKKLNKEVLPRLSNAHNYSYNSLPVYHFLAELQHQNKRPSLIFFLGRIG